MDLSVHIMDIKGYYKKIPDSWYTIEIEWAHLDNPFHCAIWKGHPGDKIGLLRNGIFMTPYRLSVKATLPNQNKFYTMKKPLRMPPCLWWLSFKCYRLFQIVRTFWGQLTFCLWGLLSSAIVCFTKWGHFEDNYLLFFWGYSPVL